MCIQSNIVLFDDNGIIRIREYDNMGRTLIDDIENAIDFYSRSANRYEALYNKYGAVEQLTAYEYNKGRSDAMKEALAFIKEHFG